MRKIFANNATSLPTVSTELKADTTYIKEFPNFEAFKTAVELGLQSRTIVETATINTFLKTLTTILKNISTDGITEYIFGANYTPYKSIKHLKFGYDYRSIYYATAENPRSLHPDADRDSNGYLDKRKLVHKTMLDDILTRMPINSTSEKGRKESTNLDFIYLSSTYYLSILMNSYKMCFLVQLSKSDIIYKNNSVIFTYKQNQPDTVTKKVNGWIFPSEQFFAFNSIYDNRDLNTQTTGGRIYILSLPNESAKYAGLSLQEMFF